MNVLSKYRIASIYIVQFFQEIWYILAMLHRCSGRAQMHQHLVAWPGAGGVLPPTSLLFDADVPCSS